MPEDAFVIRWWFQIIVGPDWALWGQCLVS